MFRNKWLYGVWVTAAAMLCSISWAEAQAPKFKVLMVFSYEEDFPWDVEIRKGLEPVLSDSCEIKYFYMNTKTNFAGGEQKAKEAFAVYEAYKPDGVIVSDDDAQNMLVVPYLKDKVKTPVIFCGVNAEPEKYGYPSSNVTGVLERLHVKESVAFAQVLVPSIKTFGYMIKESPVGHLNHKQIQNDEKEISTAKFIGAKMPKTLREAMTMTEELKSQCDMLILSTMTGITDDSGNSLTDKEVVPMIVKAFGKPVVGTERQVMMAGALCNILRTGQEQGKLAAEMALKAMQGTPVPQIPIVRNKNGQAMINVTTLKAMGITVEPSVLHSAELVKSE